MAPKDRISYTGSGRREAISSVQSTLTETNIEEMSIKQLMRLLLGIDLEGLKAKITELTDRLDDQKASITKLETSLDGLKTTLTQCDSRIDANTTKINGIIEVNNAEKTARFAKYNDAVKCIKTINSKLKEAIIKFKKADNIEALEKLAYYLAFPSEDLQIDILRSTESIPLAAEIVKEINAFNLIHKPALIAYLESEGKKWEECVYFPSTKEYDSDSMEASTPDLANGNQVYVFTVGLSFPHDEEEVKPFVAPRLLNNND